MQIDIDKDMHAIVRIESADSSDYAHIHVCIRNAAGDDFGLRDVRLNISCQIGSTYEPTAHSYGHRYLAEGSWGGMSTYELKAMVKVMSKIDRYMSKLSDEVGYPANFAEFATRVIKGARVKTVHFPHNGRIEFDTRHESVCDTSSFGMTDIRKRLFDIEQRLISEHCTAKA